MKTAGEKNKEIDKRFYALVSDLRHKNCDELLGLLDDFRIQQKSLNTLEEKRSKLKKSLSITYKRLQKIINPKERKTEKSSPN